MAFAIPIVRKNYGLYGSQAGSGEASLQPSPQSSGPSSASITPHGSPPKILVSAPPATGPRRPPLARSGYAITLSTSDGRLSTTVMTACTAAGSSGGSRPGPLSDQRHQQPHQQHLQQPTQHQLNGMTLSGGGRKGLRRNANSFTSFHEAVLGGLSKAMRKISR